MENKMGFGFVNDNDESLQSKSGGKFGLNQGHITTFEYNATAGKDNAPADAIDITVLIGQREFRRRIYDITGPLFNAKNEQVQPDEEGYTALYNAELTQRMAVVTHVVKALGVTDQQIQAALAQPPANFAEWAKIMCALPGDGFKSKPVDVFLEFEWSIGEGNDQTYLQLAKNMKGGRFLCPAQPAVGGTWNPVQDEKGLRYTDGGGNEHPFTRSVDFMTSNKATQQRAGQDAAEATGLAGGAADAGGEKPAASTW